MVEHIALGAMIDGAPGDGSQIGAYNALAYPSGGGHVAAVAQDELDSKETRAPEPAERRGFWGAAHGDSGLSLAWEQSCLAPLRS